MLKQRKRCISVEEKWVCMDQVQVIVLSVEDYSVLYELYYFDLKRHWVLIGREMCQ